MPAGTEMAALVEHESDEVEEMRDDDEGRDEQGTVEVFLDQFVALELPENVCVVLDGWEGVAVKEHKPKSY